MDTLTVRELIALLQQKDQNLPVYLEVNNSHDPLVGLLDCSDTGGEFVLLTSEEE